MSKKLLLADDSITIQKVIQITFAHEDYDLTVTDNGDAALQQAQTLRPDLVMADVYMPGKNGYEVCAAIKQDPALQHTPVLLLAGSFEPFDEDKAKAAKADAWIEKPFESQALLDKVSELLSAAPAAAAEAPAEPVAAAPAAAEVAAAPADAFGEISFDEEPVVDTPVEEAAISAVGSDDWGGLGDETPAGELSEAPAMDAFEVEVAEEPTDDFVFETELDDAAADDFSFETEPEPVAAEPAGIADDFSFETDEPVAAVEEPDLGVFAEEDGEDEEILALEEDDILGAEDLEPAPEEPTLAAWSRDDLPEVDGAADLEPEPVAPVTPVETAPEPMAEEPEISFDEPIEEVAVAPEPVPEVDLSAPAVAATIDDVATRASALTEAELEQIVERVAGQVIEKLAGTILEKVAWEVVPDLAENMIKDEIRKIKENAA